MNNEFIARELLKVSRDLTAVSVERTWEFINTSSPMGTLNWSVRLVKGSSFDVVSKAMVDLEKIAERQIKTFVKRDEFLQRGSSRFSGDRGGIILTVEVALKWPNGTPKDEIDVEMRKARFSEV